MTSLFDFFHHLENMKVMEQRQSRYKAWINLLCLHGELFPEPNIPEPGRIQAFLATENKMHFATANLRMMCPARMKAFSEALHAVSDYMSLHVQFFIDNDLPLPDVSI